MSTIVRFAPSPTGQIHIGNTRTALFNWLFARQNDGRFILRFDDTDQQRSRTEYADQIEQDLAWLGIEPDLVLRQSDRFALYEQAVTKLKDAGVLYPCYETAEELERRRKIRLSRRMPPVYGREALKLTDEDQAKLEAEGHKPHWRFLLPNFDGDPTSPQRTDVHWDDVVRGPQTVDLASMSDPVLVREDGTFLYTLPSVADDIDLGITHVLRGDDHVTNTGAQIALFRALGAEPPKFGHHNLLTTASGEGLSKRSGALSVRSLREDGVEPMAVSSLAVLIGTSASVEACPTMDALAQRFVPSSSSKSAAKFDPAELRVLSHTLLQSMDFADVAERLAAMGIAGSDAETFWLAVRGNIDRVSDAADWWSIVNEGPAKVDLSDEDQVFVDAAFDVLPSAPWDHGVWRAWTDAVKLATGRKGKALFHPLRLALTGKDSGPELADLLPLIGRERLLARR